MKQSIFFIALAGILLPSCSTISNSMREPNSRVEFEAEDFEFSNQVSASASSVRILGLDFTRLFSNSTSGSVGGAGASVLSGIPVVGNLIASPVQGYALYDMIEDNPGYDVVFYPRFKTTATCPILGLCFILTREKVEAKARLGRIKYGFANAATQAAFNSEGELVSAPAAQQLDEKSDNAHESSSDVSEGPLEVGSKVWFNYRSQQVQGEVEAIRGGRAKINFVLDGESRDEVLPLEEVSLTKSGIRD